MALSANPSLSNISETLLPGQPLLVRYTLNLMFRTTSHNLSNIITRSNLFIGSHQNHTHENCK